MFNKYLDINPKTGKKKRTTRRGFETKKEAKLALARPELGDESFYLLGANIEKVHLIFCK